MCDHYWNLIENPVYKNESQNGYDIFSAKCKCLKCGEEKDIEFLGHISNSSSEKGGG